MSGQTMSCVAAPPSVEPSSDIHLDDQLRVVLAKRLKVASNTMMLELTDDQVEQALAYSELLLKWNRTSNLTAIRTLEGIVDKHFLDSLAIVGQVRGTTVIDLGSGSGFPGIAIALVKPQTRMILLDAKQKKVQFLRHAVATLGFTNVSVVHQRIQQLATDAIYDTIVARSLGSVAAIAELAMPLLAPGGRVIAMKGKRPTEEIAALKTPCRVSVKKLKVPFVEGERHAVILEHPEPVKR